MKSAFIRSKRNAAALMDDRQATPSEYAEDKVEFAADDLAHDTANVAVMPPEKPPGSGSTKTVPPTTTQIVKVQQLSTKP